MRLISPRAVEFFNNGILMVTRANKTFSRRPTTALRTCLWRKEYSRISGGGIFCAVYEYATSAALPPYDEIQSLRIGHPPYDELLSLISYLSAN